MKEHDDSDAAVLERFMKEFFPFKEFHKSGFFTKEMKDDYPAMAKKVCDYFGYKTVYEYGAIGYSCHISYADPTNKPFITTVKSIYED